MSETDHSERVIQGEELSASDGQEDRPAFVAYDGKVYDVTAAPYIDSDGTECQVSIFRNRGER